MSDLDILTLNEAKQALKITETSNDDRLAQVVTAISGRLDDLCGPIVKRTITNEPHDLAPYTTSFWVRHPPLYSTPALTVSSFDSNGTLTTHTLEDYDTKPTYGYRLEPRPSGGYTGRLWARASTGPGYWGVAVLVTYDAGRYADTDSVDATFKEAARVALANWWGQVLPGDNRLPQGDFDTPGYRFPTFAIPKAAVDIIPADEIMSVPVVA